MNKNISFILEVRNKTLMLDEIKFWNRTKMANFKPLCQIDNFIKHEPHKLLIGEFLSKKEVILLIK